MQIECLSRPAKRAWTTNANTSAFASKISTTTEPANDGVVDLSIGGGGIIPEKLLLLPIGAGADNDAFSMRVYGWKRIGSGPAPGTLWMPIILAEVTCICCAQVGVAGSPVLSTERFCDTIAIVAARQRVITDTDSGGAASRGTVEIISPTNDLIGFLIVPTLGCEKIEPIFDQTTNTPTMNCLYAAY